MTESEQTSSAETVHWLQRRQQPGNWMDIAETDEIPTDIEGWYITVLHMFQIAFAPEIRRRIATAQLDNDFFLTSAQLIQPEESRKIIRLNEEVRGTALVRTNRSVRQGEPVFVSDMKNFVAFDLEDDELDAGHFTLLWTGNGWIATFDFRTGRAKSTSMLIAATQFLDVAKFSAESGHERPSIDNLFSACELVSKAHLILHHNSASKAKSHRHVKSAINAWRRLGNINDAFVHLFNRMSQARSPARYDPSARVEMPSPTDFQIVQGEIEHLAKLVSRRAELAEMPTQKHT